MQKVTPRQDVNLNDAKNLVAINSLGSRLEGL